MSTAASQPDLSQCVHGFITISCTQCRCQTHRDDVQSLREYQAGLATVHPSDLDTPNVLDLIGIMGQLAHRIYVRQRVAALDGTGRIECGEIYCCGGSAGARHLEHVAQALRELSVI